MKRNIFVLICFSLFLLGGCVPPGGYIRGDGDLVNEQIDISAYDRITISGTKVILNYIQREEEPASLLVHTDRNIYEMFSFTTEGGTLRIAPKAEFKNGQFRATQFTVTTQSPSLSYVSTGGSTIVNLNSPLTGEHMEVSISGGAKCYFHERSELYQLDIRVSGGGTVKGENLYLQRLDSRVSGGGHLTLGGEAAHGEYKVSGGGSIEAENMATTGIEANVSGGGRLKLYALETLNARVSGGGSVRYKGAPPTVHKVVSGGGSVKPL